MTITITHPTLYVLVFGPLSHGAGNAEHGLAKTWATASALGITQPVDAELPVQLPAELPMDDVWLKVVGAKTNPGGRDTRLPSRHMTSLLWPCGWGPMRPRPETAMPGSICTGDGVTPRTMSISLVFSVPHMSLRVSLMRMPPNCKSPERIPLTRYSPPTPGQGFELSAVFQPGIAVWDIEMTPRGRCVVALADPSAASVFGEWCWFTGTRDDDGPMLRYFMHASKLGSRSVSFRRDRGCRKQEDALDTRIGRIISRCTSALRWQALQPTS